MDERSAAGGPESAGRGRFDADERPTPEEVIALALEAISDRAPERLRPLLADDVTILTDRGEHSGIEPALAWAAKGYQHLDRRYVIERVEEIGADRLVTARVEYVWRESGEVGDSTPAFLAFRLDGDRVRMLAIHDEREAARRALGAADSGA